MRTLRHFSTVIATLPLHVNVYDSAGKNLVRDTNVFLAPYRSGQGRRIHAELFTMDVSAIPTLKGTVDAGFRLGRRTLDDFPEQSETDLERQVEEYLSLGQMSDMPLSVMTMQFPEGVSCHLPDAIVQQGAGLYFREFLRDQGTEISNWRASIERRGPLARIKVAALALRHTQLPYRQP